MYGRTILHNSMKGNRLFQEQISLPSGFYRDASGHVIRQRRPGAVQVHQVLPADWLRFLNEGIEALFIRILSPLCIPEEDLKQAHAIFTRRPWKMVPYEACAMWLIPNLDETFQDKFYKEVMGVFLKSDLGYSERCGSLLDINQYEKVGKTILMEYVEHSKYSKAPPEETGSDLDHMIKMGADVNFRSREGMTALSIAVVGGHVAATKTLLDHQANVHVRNHTGQGILQMASKRKWVCSVTGNESFYAQITTCMALVIDAGAIASPSKVDGWSIPKKRSERYELLIGLSMAMKASNPERLQVLVGCKDDKDDSFSWEGYLDNFVKMPTETGTSQGLWPPSDLGVPHHPQESEDYQVQRPYTYQL